ncbi:MAG: DUF4382 domain-containing protein [Saprospiraceae bacterium]|jgi:hypothetical protein|nr:DUF4382 domain-containing protein [Saprospiraceae bacterium]
MKKYPIVWFSLFLALAVWACSKDEDSTTLRIRLTDGPGDFQQVNVDIQEVVLKLAKDTSKWQTLPTNAGIYNLLDFQNGVDTLLASGSISTDVLKEVRLVLGSNNTVMVDSVVYNLETPSAEQSGLKIKVDKSLAISLDSLTLDFDAEQSIVKNGNGTYILKPVIKVKN